MLLRFPSEQRRAAFLRRLEHEAPELVPLAKESFVQSNVLSVRERTAADSLRLRTVLGHEPSVQVFEDKKLKVFR